MATKSAYRRLSKEYLNIQKSPPPYLIAKPLDSNILEWHYILRGPPDTPYHNGEYHGKLVFPSDYPYKPPSIRMITPSGRFQTDTRLCLTMSDFHPSSWNPSWSVATILNGLLSFMVANESTTGSIKTTDADKRIYAARSHAFNLNNAKFRDVFPELCKPEATPVEILYPIDPATSPSKAAAPAQDTAAAQKQQPQQKLTQRSTATSGTATVAEVAGGAAHARNNAETHHRGGGIFSMEQWRSWCFFLLVCLYLLAAKLVARSSSGGSA